MRSSPRPECYLCGAAGAVLHADLTDRLFGAEGRWNMRRCGNGGCGLLWLDPMPLEEDIGEAYRNYYTHEARARSRLPLLARCYEAIRRSYLATHYGYFPGRVSWPGKIGGWLAYLHPGRRAVMDFNVMHLDAHPGGRLLDVGCGSGEAAQLMQELGWSVVGVDADPQAVQAARRRGIDVRIGSLEEQNFPDARFDAVTLSHVIEHVHDPERVLRECRRLLEPSGRLSMVTPNPLSYAHRRYGRDWRSLEPPRHLHLFPSAALRSLAGRAGFESITVRTSIRNAYGTYLASRTLSQQNSRGLPQPAAVRLWARAMELGEWLRLQYDPDAGEEIVLLATR